ncbi:hypothetical protein GY45DRAFT_734449 [Cubamyces sp. BRFM 1775]|nr:hypothetical protein GY45DRAFT_734449 [Cubamyces sp. BRFM 1775]
MPCSGSCARLRCACVMGRLPSPCALRSVLTFLRFLGFPSSPPCPSSLQSSSRSSSPGAHVKLRLTASTPLCPFLSVHVGVFPLPLTAHIHTIVRDPLLRKRSLFLFHASPAPLARDLPFLLPSHVYIGSLLPQTCFPSSSCAIYLPAKRVFSDTSVLHSSSYSYCAILVATALLAARNTLFLTRIFHLWRRCHKYWHILSFGGFCK